MKYLVILFMLVWSNFSYSSDPFKVFISPSGNDQNDGLSNAFPVKTLNQVQDILEAHNPDQSVEIHINQGTYLNQSVVWTYTNDHSITFTPIGFTNDRPVFDGGGNTNTWFTLAKRDGKASNLKFRYIKVQNYNTAMSFHGNRNDINKGNSSNELYGMYFYKIGGKFTSFDYSTAAVRFVNSKNNSVANTHFVEILNNPAEASLIHAIYLAHHSSNNEIVRNRFLTTNGDPIRVRDESNHNYIAENRFYTSGKVAFYSDWYCSPDTTRNTCTKASGECPSIGNEFRSNNLYSGYNGDIKTFQYYGIDDYCGGLSIPRLRTSGNIKHY